jgi:hypothetical protein
MTNHASGPPVGLDRLVGRTIGCRPGRDRGIWLWADVRQVQATPCGCLLLVVHPLWHGSGRWVAGRDVRTRSKRDAEILAKANAPDQARLQPSPEAGCSEVQHCLDCKHVAKCSPDSPCDRCRWGGGKSDGPLQWQPNKEIVQ